MYQQLAAQTQDLHSNAEFCNASYETGHDPSSTIAPYVHPEL